MVTDDIKVVDGFSARFNELLDMAHFPKKGRFTRGAEKFGVRINTFSDWCKTDEPPRYFKQLVQIVEEILEDIPGDYDPKAVAGWLQTGNVKGVNPFQEYDIDYAVIGSIYNVMADMLVERDLSIEPEVTQKITKTVYFYVLDQERKGIKMHPIKSNETIKNILASKLDLIAYGIE
jgi:hypothetical protein